MKKKTLPALALLGAVSGAACAQSAVSVYGVIDLSVRYVSNNSGSMWTQQSGDLMANRIGFSGTEDLGGGTTASFRLESTVTADAGTAGGVTVPNGQFWNRMSWLSLKNPRLGELRLGRDYHLAFLNIAPLEPFNFGGLGSISNLLSGAQTVPINQAFGTVDAASGLGAATTVASANNSITYYTPNTLGGFNAAVMVALDEGAARVSNTGNAKFRALRLGYASGPLDVALTHARTSNTNLPGQSLKETVLGGTYNFGAVKLHGIFTDLSLSSTKARVWLLGATAPVGSVGSVRVAYSRIDQSGTLPGTQTSIDDRDAYQLAVGYTYNLSKRTALYANAARVSNRGAVAAFSEPGGPAFRAGTGRSSTGYGFGVRHTF